MSVYRLIIPVLNSRVVGLVGTPWQLSTETSVETVLDEDHAALLRDPPANDADRITIKSKVVHVRGLSERPSNEEVLKQAAIAQFCLNFFAVEPGLSMSWACLVTAGKRNQMSVVEFFDLAKAPIASVSRHRIFKFDKNLKRPAFMSMHLATRQALANFPGALMTIDRFCRAVSRDDSFDRLVDLCICLESLIDGSNELRFRFSQLHAVVGEKDLAKRLGAFKLFQDFYDARSKVVHGDPAASQKVNGLEQRWAELTSYAKTTLAYYFAFLSENTRENWNNHTRNISLGIESPNNGE